MSHARARGFSLVELMVAMVAGMIVTTAVIAFALSSMKSNSEYVQSTRLTQELRNTLDLVTRELRRSGYDESALGNLATGNPSTFSRLKLDNAVTSGGNTYYTCVIYAYDRSVAGGTQGGRDLANGEVRAIRWYSRTVDGSPIGVMEYAESAGSTAPACDGASPDYSQYPAACNGTSHWCALSDPKVLDITEFHITDDRSVVGSGTTVVQLRNLGVTMQGRIAGTTDTVRDVRSDIRVRSDCYDATISNCSISP